MLTLQHRADGNLASRETKSAKSIPSQIRQCVDNQRVLRAIIDCPDSKPLEVASCVRAWDEMSERIRILRGKPLPGALQPGEKARRSGRRRIAAMTPESVAAAMSAAA